MPFTLTLLLCVAMGCGTYLAGRRMRPHVTPEAPKGAHTYLFSYEMSRTGETCRGYRELIFTHPLNSDGIQKAAEQLKKTVTDEFPQYADSKVVILSIYKFEA